MPLDMIFCTVSTTLRMVVSSAITERVMVPVNRNGPSTDPGYSAYSISYILFTFSLKWSSTSRKNDPFSAVPNDLKESKQCKPCLVGLHGVLAPSGQCPAWYSTLFQLGDTALILTYFGSLLKAQGQCFVFLLFFLYPL